MSFSTVKSLSAKEVISGYTARSIHTGTMTFVYRSVKAGAIMPEHSHLHEQVANELNGTFKLTVDGETRLPEPNLVTFIPPHMLHGGKGHPGL